MNSDTETPPDLPPTDGVLAAVGRVLSQESRERRRKLIERAQRICQEAQE